MSAPTDQAIPVDEATKATKAQKSEATTTAPVLGAGFQEYISGENDRSTESSDVEENVNEDDSKPGLRERLFGFGKKKDDSKGKSKKKAGLKPVGKGIAEPTAKPQAKSPTSTHPYQSQSVPHRNLHSSPPGVISPAGSQIFERDVQESLLTVPNSPAIPSHMQTENHIPSVLDASSEAITNRSIDPDSVEIVMTSSHQPAAVQVTGISGNSEAVGNPWAEDFLAHPDKEDAASNYGALDSTDVRRLSFISFADVVQSEHAEHTGGRDPIHVAGLTSFSSGHRSPSPMRSPVSSQGVGSSPPTSNSASIKGIDLSPTRKPLGSPHLGTTISSGGELTIETMSQALRKTGSGDLSGARSQTMSSSSPDGLSERLFR